ncbi:hypothetical protein LZ30DRAFT_251968 [Colletotrichum cereale]|nr:hypothetical protein LZ30DRAFT_251968 [Colletotrichum cereale]
MQTACFRVCSSLFLPPTLVPSKALVFSSPRINLREVLCLFSNDCDGSGPVQPHTGSQAAGALLGEITGFRAQACISSLPARNPRSHSWLSGWT